MKLNFIISLLLLLTTLHATESLQMSEDGGIKNVSSNCTNTTCTVTLSAGSQLFFRIQNTTNKNLVITKFEITKTYNGQEVTQTSTTDSSLLGGDSFNQNESVNLGYNLVNNEIANYWTGKYYLLDLDTGEKFINSLNWNNNLTSYSVVATDITENKINVSTTAELRAALTTAASDGKDTVIYLADGNYTTTEDGLGQFQYSTSQNHSLTIKGSNRDNVILSGEDTNRVLYLSGGKDFHLENITIEKGYVDGKGGGVWANKDVYLTSSTVRNNNTESNYGNAGGGLYLHGGSIYVLNSLIENNFGYEGGGFNCSFASNAEVRNSLIKNNNADEASGFYSGYAQVYNSIIESNNDNSGYYSSAFYSFHSISLVNSLVINNKHGIQSYSGDSYIVNSILTNNSEYDIKSSNATFHISHSYLDGNLSATHFDDDLITNGNLGFVDADNQDYRLTADSVLVDAGTIDNNAVDIPLLDMDGYKRVSGASIDIGPYELSSSRPTLYTFSYSGEAKEFSELTFKILYDIKDGRSLDSIAYDYTNDGSWTTSNTHTFDRAGIYTVNVKVTDSDGEFSTTSKTVTISPLAFNEMTDEQKLKKAIDPAYYDQIVAIIEAEKTTSTASGVTTGENNVVLDPNSYGLHTQAELTTAIAETNATATTAGIATGKAYVQNHPSVFSLVTQTAYNTAVETATASGRDSVLSSPSAYGLVSTSDLNSSVSEALASGITQGKQYVQNNLAEFGLISKSDIELTASSISRLSAGWTLVSTPLAITDLSIFDSASVVWVYNNASASWGAYSSDATTKQKIIDKAGVNLITSIPAGSGIWVLK